jgi:hypothetical protein
MPESQWRLSIGIHNGTFTSRDYGEWGVGYDSREDAVAAIPKARKDYARLGYVLWFVTLYAPDGTQESLGGNTDYNNDRPFAQMGRCKVNRHGGVTS